MTPEENLIVQTAKVSDTVLSATESVIKYLEGHTSKTEVVNQLDSIHTPDVKFVVEALQVLDETLKTHENTDLSEITGVMRELLSEARQIPKSLPEQKDTDYTEQLKGLLAAVQAVESVVKAQKLVVEAPVVNVPETNVHVAPPNLEPIRKGIADLLKLTKSGQPELVNGAVRTHEMTGLLNQPYDEYRVIYSAKFDDDEDARVSATDYYQAGKKVFSLKYRYDTEGKLLGAKRT